MSPASSEAIDSRNPECVKLMLQVDFFGPVMRDEKRAKRMGDCAFLFVGSLHLLVFTGIIIY